MSRAERKRTEYATELKLTAVRGVLAGESVRAVAEELGVRRKRVYVWKDRYAQLGEAGLAQSGARAGDAKHQSTLGGPHHLRATAGGVCLCRRGPGCALAPRDRLGAGSASGGESGRGGFAQGAT